MHDDRVASVARGRASVGLAGAHPRRAVAGFLGGGLATLLARFAGEARKRRRRKKRRHKDKTTRPQPPPTEMLDANCPVAGASQVVRLPALTFVPRRSGVLTRARLLLMDSQAGQDFTLALALVDAAGKPSEDFLASEEVLDVPESGHGHPAQPLAITFSDPALVVRGARYALVVLSGQGFQIALGQTGQCPDSFAFDVNQDSVFTELPGRDFAFETFVFG